jgi:hypothetical protein
MAFLGRFGLACLAVIALSMAVIVFLIFGVPVPPPPSLPQPAPELVTDAPASCDADGLAVPETPLSDDFPDGPAGLAYHYGTVIDGTTASGDRDCFTLFGCPANKRLTLEISGTSIRADVLDLAGRVVRSADFDPKGEKLILSISPKEADAFQRSLILAVSSSSDIPVKWQLKPFSEPFRTGSKPVSRDAEPPEEEDGPENAANPTPGEKPTRQSERNEAVDAPFLD